MIRLFRRRGNAAIIDRLHERIIAASRAPALYLDLGVPDTLDGRFESLTLHAALVLRRLGGCEAPGPEMAQHLVDTVFAHFDRSFREMGVGDTSVPKRMKTVVEAFLGRSAAYDAALRAAAGHAPAPADAQAAQAAQAERAADGARGDRSVRNGAHEAAAADPLAAALARNVYSARPADDAAAAARRLARYAAATAAAIGEAPLQSFIEGAVPWLDAGAFATETAEP